MSFGTIKILVLRFKINLIPDFYKTGMNYILL